MTEPVRLQLSRAKGFDLQRHSFETNGLSAIVVARPSAWGNPFIVGSDGDRERCVERFRRLVVDGYVAPTHGSHIAEQHRVRDHIAAHLALLKGRNLACWCRLDGKPCHADVASRARAGAAMKTLVEILGEGGDVAAAMADAIVELARKGAELGELELVDAIDHRGKPCQVRRFPDAWRKRLELAADRGAFEKMPVEAIVERILSTPGPA